MSPTDGWTLGVLVGMGVVTVVTRCFFFISNRSWQLPHWAQRGLQYAPIAALSAVVLPEVVMTQGQLITTWPLETAGRGAALRLRERPIFLSARGKVRRCWAPLFQGWWCTCRCISAWAGSALLQCVV